MKHPTLSLALSIGMVLLAMPAHAQYWGTPYGFGMTSFWPGRMLLNPWRLTSYFSGGGYGLASPYNAIYLGNSLLQSAAYYNHSRKILDTQRMEMREYQDEEPLSNPRQRSRPFRPSEQVVDQSVHASWQPAPSPGAPAASQPYVGGMPAPPGATSYTQPIHRTQVPPPAVAPSSGPLYPAPAPSLARNTGLLPPTAPLAPSKPQLPTAGKAPLAEGFISLVNNEFNGNISLALRDPLVRAWSDSLGISNKKLSLTDLPEGKTRLIEGILKEESLDPVRKVEAIKALLN